MLVTFCDTFGIFKKKIFLVTFWILFGYFIDTLGVLYFQYFWVTLWILFGYFLDAFWIIFDTLGGLLGQF